MDIHHYFILFIDVSQLSIEEEGYAAYDDLQQSLVDKDDKGSDQSIYVSHYLNISMYCLLLIFYENIPDQPCRFLALAAVVNAHLTKCIIIENNVVNKELITV